MQIFFRKYLKKNIGKIVKILPNLQQKINSGVTVFAFHDVTNNPSKFIENYGLSVSKENFKKQIFWIKSNFNIVHPNRLLTGEVLPARAAIISFDDGYLGTFINGLPILKKLNVPSIIFLNMKPILNSTPLISAVSCYLSENNDNFVNFCNYYDIKPPFHLNLNPTHWCDFVNKNGEIDYPSINKYQGKFVDLATLKKWDANNLVCFGNHLFEHWNAAALTSEEFIESYTLNKEALKNLVSNINLFAFTNGRPFTCFTMREIIILKSLKVERVFSAVGGINKVKENFLIGRVALSDAVVSDDELWFALGRGALNDKMNHSLR